MYKCHELQQSCRPVKPFYGQPPSTSSETHQHSTNVNEHTAKKYALRRCVLISKQLHTADQLSSAQKSRKNAVKETQNNEVGLQTNKDRKVHYAIGQLYLDQQESCLACQSFVSGCLPRFSPQDRPSLLPAFLPRVSAPLVQDGVMCWP